MRRAGLDPDRPYVLFLGSSPFVTNHSDLEVRFVERWLESLRSAPDEGVRGAGVLVRPHPVGKGWRDADLSRFGDVAIWRHTERPVSTGGARRLLRHARPQRGRGRNQHDGDDRGGGRRQERADDPGAGVRPGEHAALPLPAWERGSCTSPRRSTSTAGSSRACSRTAPRTPSGAAASSSRSSARTASTSRRRRSSPTPSSGSPPPRSTAGGPRRSGPCLRWKPGSRPDDSLPCPRVRPRGLAW